MDRRNTSLLEYFFQIQIEIRSINTDEAIRWMRQPMSQQPAAQGEQPRQVRHHLCKTHHRKLVHITSTVSPA